MASAVKAVAAMKGQTLRVHRELRDYARALAKELSDDSLSAAYRDAEGMHSNFYEGDLTSEDVRRVLNNIRRAVGRLLNLVPSESVPPPAS
jgi:NAD(P)-dependent dehydrogenase (short-subunit alcohol dehydrogenase family)